MNSDVRNSVTKEEIENIIKKLQWLLAKMENKQIDFIVAEANTYLISEHISIAGKGFIDLYDLGNYIDEPNEDYEEV